MKYISTVTDCYYVQSSSGKSDDLQQKKEMQFNCICY